MGDTGAAQGAAGANVIGANMQAGRTPIFFPLQAPKIKSFDPKTIAKFLREKGVCELGERTPRAEW